jgi:hypothetical protein
MAKNRNIQETPLTSNPHNISSRLPSGYEGQNVSEFSMPTCGIEDVDRSVYELFNSQIGFVYKTSNQNIAQIPVIFAGAERFAILKSKKAIRDKNGVLILPLITIEKTTLDQTVDGGLGRGVGQDTGDFVIKTRLDKSDRRYQNIMNKMNLQNQENISTAQHNNERLKTVDGASVGTLGTRRKTGGNEFNLANGEVLGNNLDGNIFEIITIPFPEFFTITYNITFWSQYQLQMNSMIEQFMASYHAQGRTFRLTTDKGYWFEGFVDGSFEADNNFQEYTEEERIIRYTATMRATGYLVAPQKEGQRSPFRKFLSAPSIEFDISSYPAGLELPRPSNEKAGHENNFILNDLINLDESGNEVTTRNHSPIKLNTYVENPFTNSKEKRYLRVKTRNQRKGETVFGSANIDILDTFKEDT